MSHTRRLLLAAVTVALLALPVAVSAAPPLIETFHAEISAPFQGPCPNGVTLLFSVTEDVRVITYFDQAGTPVRLQATVNHVGEITNPETGQTVEDLGHLIIILDLVEGTETHAGLDFTTTVPGVGVVFHDVGRVVFDAEGNVIFEAGPHDVLNIPGDHVVRAAFCAALT